MELEKLCEKIISDSQLKASQIIDEANKKATQLIESAEKKYIEKNKKSEEKSVLKAKEVHDKIVSDAHLNVKKALLLKKRELISDAFKTAENILLNLPFSEYMKYLSKKAEKINEKAEVMVIKQFSDKITDKALKEINPLLSKSEKNAEFGFSFIFHNSCLNYDFKEMINRLMKEKDSEVSSILFS